MKLNNMFSLWGFDYNNSQIHVVIISSEYNNTNNNMNNNNSNDNSSNNNNVIACKSTLVQTWNNANILTCIPRC